MQRVISTERLPIKLWLDAVEEGALEQAKHLANLPFAFKHIALMPDCHQGYGMPIGGVMATENVIVPNAVGADIGCGMCAVKTSLGEVKRQILEQIIVEIKKAIPVGKIWHEKAQADSLMPVISNRVPIVHQEYPRALYQLGTLGSGNHFIEIQKGSDGYIWIMVHSGSRNIGKRVADYYNKLAAKLNSQWFSQVPREWNLAFLPLNSDEARSYRNEMEYCVNFALANRAHMLQMIKVIFLSFLEGVIFSSMIDIAHNYASMEHHFGKNVMVHRKGATKAREGQLGIIPGSQGTKSYIVKGKGNSESFQSCSHGAGRKMGRKEAIRQLNLATEKAFLDEQGIIHSLESEEALDEASSAYKDIDEVMTNQQDLVEIVVELTPLAVVKG